MLKGKTVVVGVTGGIAAYKAADLVSKLKKLGAEVHCIMTKGAQAFLTPLTLRTLSGNQVVTEMFTEPKVWNVAHISLAEKADIFLVVPATANIIGKIANGIADDFLTTTVMASKSRVVFVPAMNVNMYENPILQENIKKLKKVGYEFIAPIEGNLACGYTGKGKMEEPEKIIEYILNDQKKDLANINVLITAGPTIESIDPVRYITNRSSGKMGYALAQCAQKRGATVTLISGPTNLETPQGVNLIKVESALEMFAEVKKHYKTSQIVIKAAAVADYRPKNYQSKKIKKSDDDLFIPLERNPDILAFLGKNKNKKVLVGFAAETNDLKENALKKIKKKNLDFIVANNVTENGSGFGYATNKVTIFSSQGWEKELPLMSKSDVAENILDEAKLALEKGSEEHA